MTDENVEFLRALAHASGTESVSSVLDSIVTKVRLSDEIQRLILDRTVRQRLPERQRSLNEAKRGLLLPESEGAEFPDPGGVLIASPRSKLRRDPTPNMERPNDDAWNYAVIEDLPDRQIQSPKELTILLAQMVLQRNLGDQMKRSFWKGSEVLRAHNKQTGGMKTQTTEVAPGVFVYTSVARTRNLYNSRLLARILGTRVSLHYTFLDGNREVTFTKEIQKTDPLSGGDEGDDQE